VRSLSGTFINCTGIRIGLRRIKTAAKNICLSLTLLLLGASVALGQSASQAVTPPAPKDSAQGDAAAAKAIPRSEALPQDHSSDLATPAPGTSTENVLTAVRPTAPAPKPFASAHGALPAANIPALEARVGFSMLSRVAASNDRVLYTGLSGSVTKQYSDRLGAMIEVSYLRAFNVFATGQTNSTFTYLIGPAFYPYRRDGLVTSFHALGGGARVAGVATLLPNSAGFVKGAVDNRAWALGGGVERWFFSDAIALRVDVDAVRTSFFNSSMKVAGEYDLRTTLGVVYYFGLRGRDGKLGNVAGKELE